MFRARGALPYELRLKSFTVILIGDPFLVNPEVIDCQNITFEEIGNSTPDICEYFMLI